MPQPFLPAAVANPANDSPATTTPSHRYSDADDDSADGLDLGAPAPVVAETKGEGREEEKGSDEVAEEAGADEAVGGGGNGGEVEAGGEGWDWEEEWARVEGSGDEEEEEEEESVQSPFEAERAKVEDEEEDESAGDEDEHEEHTPAEAIIDHSDDEAPSTTSPLSDPAPGKPIDGDVFHYPDPDQHAQAEMVATLIDAAVQHALAEAAQTHADDKQQALDDAAHQVSSMCMTHV